MTVVADATVLIYLAKLDRLELLDTLFDRVLVPEAVYEEVVTRGREQRYADALAIDDATDDFLCMQSLSGDATDHTGDIEESTNLGNGEVAAIALALCEDARCLTDDHAARLCAESLGVAVGGTIYVLLEALQTDRVSHDKYIELLEALDEKEFRMSARLYRQAVEAGEEISE
ncbi:MAG TPA: hypothetical protein VFJ06_06305 [Halococcus sp.]|nr:hypothetical protein [Halococcus sp.]